MLYSNFVVDNKNLKTCYNTHMHRATELRPVSTEVEINVVGLSSVLYINEALNIKIKAVLILLNRDRLTATIAQPIGNKNTFSFLIG